MVSAMISADFIANRLAKAIGMDSQCRDVRFYGESVLINGRSHGYPMGLPSCRAST
jgi:hypothetical protein